MIWGSPASLSWLICFWWAGKLEIGKGIEMKNIAIVVVFPLFLVGCANDYHRIVGPLFAASAIPECGVDDIEIENEAMGLTHVTFEAVCNGRTYTCRTRQWDGKTQCSLDSSDSSSNTNNTNAVTSKEPEEVQPKAKVSVAQSEDTEAVSSSAQGNPESTQASSLSLEISEANEQENRSTQKSFTTNSNSTDVKSLYSANNDDEIYQYLGRSSSDIKDQLELRYHNDCTLRSDEFSFCDTTFLYRSKQSEFSVETRQAGGVTVQRIHGFQGENYAGLKVHISGASKFLLAAIDQQVRQVKTQRLDLQVLLETPKPGEVILWFGHDLKTLDDILFDHAKPAES
jgi:hypothetical protein